MSKKSVPQKHPTIKPNDVFPDMTRVVRWEETQYLKYLIHCMSQEQRLRLMELAAGLGEECGGDASGLRARIAEERDEAARKPPANDDIMAQAEAITAAAFDRPDKWQKAIGESDAEKTHCLRIVLAGENLRLYPQRDMTDGENGDDEATAEFHAMLFEAVDELDLNDLMAVAWIARQLTCAPRPSGFWEWLAGGPYPRQAGAS